jgi:alkyl sulfatase BDS1-like metallo-beta-lactamase superfamily hydrolase
MSFASNWAVGTDATTWFKLGKSLYQENLRERRDPFSWLGRCRGRQLKKLATTQDLPELIELPVYLQSQATLDGATC